MKRGYRSLIDQTFLKTYKLMPREAYFALLDEATKVGLPVTGHVPFAVDVIEAANAGHRSMEHARVFAIRLQ